MNLRKQKELASRTLGVSKKRIKFNTQTAEAKKSLKEIIARDDVRTLVEDKIITKLAKKGNSRTRANHIKAQKAKGRMSGHGSRKGTANARFKDKRKWIIKIRALRMTLQKLKSKGRLDTKTFRELYLKSKGNFFRNKRHMSLYMEQNKLLKEEKKDGKE